jgi:hypothetical protein
VADTSQVVAVINNFKAALARRDATQVAEMVRRWLAVDSALSGNIEGLATELAQLKAAGKAVSQWKVARMQRYQDLLGQMRFEMNGYARYAADVIAKEQLYYGMTGIREASASLAAITGRLEGSFSLLPISAVHSMIGLAGNGSPLLKLLNESWPAASQQLTQALVNGTALGWNPRRTAKLMTESMDSEGLGRAITIARTETLRAYRSASAASYRESGRVRGFKRICARQARTCLPCLVLDGTFYPVESEFAEHPSGRCALVPCVKGYDDPTWATGREWLESQDEATQRDIMGSARYEAWRDGSSLERMVTHTEDKTWGPGVALTPLGK